MRTRCPACDTIFRVTSEQLRLKAGKVRCGHCQGVFNAFDHLVSESEEVSLAAGQPARAVIPDEPAAIPQPLPTHSLSLSAEDDASVSLAPVVSDLPAFSAVPQPESEILSTESTPLSVVPPAADSRVAVQAAEMPMESCPKEEPLHPPVDSALIREQPSAVRTPESATEPADHTQNPVKAARAEIPAETPEESTLAAREAGLVAARELLDTQAYDRWAAGTLAESGLGGFDSESGQRMVWPFVLVSVLLSLVLSGQVMHHFRTDVVRKFPAFAAVYDAVGVKVPLPRLADQVTIETSDLQSDNARGLFVLQATLVNRAHHVQAWPMLELTLTDTADSVVARRVLAPADYLPPAQTAPAFPANGEVAVRLWLEARGLGAAGYRLYVFYP
jgi:predicted Zn finger-like uncharacterized protein